MLPVPTIETPTSYLDYLLSLPSFAHVGGAAYRPGLERMEALLDAMGRPERAYPSVHVAGTNGKGSTASMIAAIATAAGLRVGLHTSPHLFDLAERLRVDGVPAPHAWLAAAVARYRPVLDEVRPSFFEATTALSLLYFAEEDVDLAVVEVGLGGRLDATNVLTPLLSVITNIGLEHTEFLGETLPAIAREKAGIIKPGVPVLTTTTQPEVQAVIGERAGACGAPWHDVLAETALQGLTPRLDGLELSIETPLRRYPNLFVGLPGAHQAHNASLAVRVAELLPERLAADPASAARGIDPEAVRAGLRGVRALAGLRGRLDVLRQEPLLVADVAHNAEGLATALAFVRAHRPQPAGLYVLLGLMRDKDLERMATSLQAAGAVVMPVGLDGERALPAMELGARLSSYGVAVGENTSVQEGLAHLLQIAGPGDAVLLTGSHQVVAQLPVAFRP